jgi:signal transduction histidine kinase/CheY-like chemotaxis protein
MIEIEYGVDPNLQELRSQLTGYVAWLAIGVGGLLMLMLLIVWLLAASKPGAHSPFPVVELGLSVALLGVGLRTQPLVKTHPTLARHFLIWSLTAGVLIAMGLLQSLWLPFLGLILIFVSELLVSKGGLVMGGVIAALALWLTHGQVRAYPLVSFLSMLALGIILAWLIARTLYAALGWAWTMQQRADHLLDLARDRQGELNRTLKSLENSNLMLRRTQRELIAARRQAEEARLMKERFAANVSHELRTPLNLILGFSEIMCVSPETYDVDEWPVALRQDIYQIYRSSRHLLEMINDVLDLSRLEMVEFALNKEPTPLEPLLQEAIDTVAGFVRECAVQLELDVESGLPTLKIDRIRIRQVLINLLSNALRLTEEGSVRVEAGQADGEVVIAVHDTGPGIPAEKMPRLFEGFYQVDRSASRRQQGSGLGLAISKHFVEAHGGRIWADSEEGVGSTFAFTLPISRQYAVPFCLSENPPSGSSLSPSPPILVLDPDPDVAALIDRALGDHPVLQVDEANRLGDLISRYRPRLVVRNAAPGQPDSFSALARGEGGDALVVDCSLPSRAWLADKLAVTACLTKPITTERLLQEIDHIGGVRDVLIVDDDRGSCRLMARMLATGRKDLNVRQAYTGQDGLRALQEQRPDLLLLDLSISEIGDSPVLAELRGNPDLATVPVILATTSSYDEDVLVQRGRKMVIQRSAGLGTVETLRYLKAVVSTVEPDHKSPHSDTDQKTS